MPLLNYTTEVSIEKSVAEIQRMLTKHGATALLIENDDTGLIESFSFKIRVPGDRIVAIRLPVNWRPILAVLEKQRVQPRYRTKEQAMRIGWRILKDWTEAQLAIIETQMVTIDQVFLPYTITRSGKTVYDVLGGDDYRHLLAPPK